MQFLTFKSKTEFFRTDGLTEDWFHSQNRMLLDHEQANWHEIKVLLLHKDCPRSLRDIYADSPIWWQRIPAMLCQHSWEEYIGKAISDPKSTVRWAAYNRMLHSELYKIEDMANLILKDTRVHGYVRPELMAELVAAHK